MYNDSDLSDSDSDESVQSAKKQKGSSSLFPPDPAGDAMPDQQAIQATKWEHWDKLCESHNG